MNLKKIIPIAGFMLLTSFMLFSKGNMEFCSWESEPQKKVFSVTGKVTDASTGAPIAGVVVLLKSAAGRLLKYDVSNTSGEYSLSLPTFPEKGSLSFQMLGYAGQLYIISGSNLYTDALSNEKERPESRTNAGVLKLERSGKKLTNENDNENIAGVVSGYENNLSVKLAMGAVKLKEVIVKPASITMKEDTLKYNVQSFVQKQDKNIGDVLKRMPGIQVMENGEIRYNGAPISNFYLNGKEMLGSRYGLATNNISPLDVAKVEVLENHQPIKALRNRAYSDKSALNIKLKESAKLKWRSTLNAAAGYADSSYIKGVAPAYDASLFTMNIGGKTNWMITAKANNVGVPLIEELTSFGNESGLGSSDYTSADYLSGSPSYSPLENKRNRLGNTQLFNLTNNAQIGEDYQLTTNAYCLREDLRSAAAAYTTYFLNDNSKRYVAEEENAHLERFSTHIDYKLVANTDKYYFTDQLSGDFGVKNTNLFTRGSYSNSQCFKMPDLLVNNNFSFVKNFGKSTLSIESVNKFSSKPHNLSVVRYPDNISSDHDCCGIEREESPHSTTFYSDNSLSNGWKFGSLSLTLEGGVGLLERKLKTENFDSKFGYLHLYAAPKIYYYLRRFKVEITSPLHYYSYYGGGGSSSLYIAPQLSLKYDISAKFNMRAGISMMRSGVDVSHFYNGEIMTNYMEIIKGHELYVEPHSINYYVAAAFKSPVHSFFINGDMGYISNRRGLSTMRDFREEYIVYSYVEGKNNADYFYVNAGVGKGIDCIDANLSVDLSYVDSHAQLMQNGATTEYTLRNWTIKPKFNGKFASWCTFDYQMKININKMIADAGKTSSDRYSHSLSLGLTPVKGINIMLSADHYHSKLSGGEIKDFILADASLYFTLTDKIELRLNSYNLFNRQYYSYISVGELQTSLYTYSIRPRTIIAGVYMKF